MDWRPFTIEDALGIKTFSDRGPIRFSPDGRLLAYGLEERSTDQPREQLWVADIGSSQARRVLPEARTAWGLSWSPVTNTLAFYGDTGEGLQLWVWHAETGDTRRVSPEVVAGEYRFEVPRWLPDGSAVVCKLANAEWLGRFYPSGTRVAETDTSAPPHPDQASVRCWESGAQAAPAGVTEAPTTGADMAGTLARVDLASGAVAPLADTRTRSWAVSPDGKFVAFARFMGGDPATAGALFDLCVCPCSGGEVTVLVEHLAAWWFGPAFSWSPDSSMIAYRAGGAVSVVSLTGEGPRTLSGHTTGGFSSGTFVPPHWSPDGSFVLVAQRAVWKLLIAAGDPVDLVSERGHIVMTDTLLAPGGGITVWSPDGKSVIAVAVDMDAEARLLVQVSLTGAGIRATSSDLRDVTMAPRFSMDISPANGLISFVREDATHPADVWLTDIKFSAPRKLTAVNSHLQESMFSAPRTLAWHGSGGTPCQSAFFPPAPNHGQPPYPTVFWVYEGECAGDLAAFGANYQQSDNVQILTSHGYAVCIPDIPVFDEHPAQSIRDALAYAVKAVINADLADPARLGIFGHSYGGYIVNIAVTGLDCFAAAITDTAMTNLTSAYGAVRDGESEWQYFEHNEQGRMGVPPWDDPHRYMDNSPLFFLDRVTTPLLIIHGAEDAQISQAWEMFSGLRRLAKTASLVVYEGESHTIERRANIIDRWHRVLDWFDRNLGVSSKQ